MTIDNVTAGELIDPEWGNAVADVINEHTAQLADLPLRIAYGSTVATTEADGDVPISFGGAFAAAPTLIATVQRNAFGQYSCHVRTISTTSATINVTLDDAGLNTLGVTVHWVAIGVRA
jgi:hypothetical protein